MKANERAYLELCGVVSVTGWPERYVSDLYRHDAQNLGIFPERVGWELPDGSPFGWILRPQGTHMVGPDAKLDNNTADVFAREWDAHNKRMEFALTNPIAHDMMREGYDNATNFLYFWWDGATLMRVPSPRTILDRMRHWQENHGKPVPNAERAETPL